MTATAAPAVIRQWARQQGIVVGDRGRLAPDVVAAFMASAASPAVEVFRPAATAKRGTQQRVRVQPLPGATGVARRARARLA